MVDKNISLIGKRKYKINDEITLKIPTLKEIRGEKSADEDEYYALLNYFILTPTDCMVMLYDLGVYFEDISDWQLFVMLAFMGDYGINGLDLSLLFDGKGTSNFKLINNNLTDTSEVDYNLLELYDENNNIHINRSVYEEISAVICKILNVKKSHRNFGHNIDTLKYIVEREKKKMERNKNKPKKRQNMDNIILALVCNSDFPYDFNTINEITIYEFNQSVLQLLKNIQVRNYGIGVYTGNIDTKKANISQKDLSIFMSD